MAIFFPQRDPCEFAFQAAVPRKFFCGCGAPIDFAACTIMVIQFPPHGSSLPCLRCFSPTPFPLAIFRLYGADRPAFLSFFWPWRAVGLILGRLLPQFLPLGLASLPKNLKCPLMLQQIVSTCLANHRSHLKSFLSFFVRSPLPPILLFARSYFTPPPPLLSLPASSTFPRHRC